MIKNGLLKSWYMIDLKVLHLMSEENFEQGISRVLCLDQKTSIQVTIIYLSDHPKTLRAAYKRFPSILLQVGFSRPTSRLAVGELLPRHFTLTDNVGGIFSVALSLRSPSLATNQHPALRSPDFPQNQKILRLSSLLKIFLQAYQYILFFSLC